MISAEFSVDLCNLCRVSELCGFVFRTYVLHKSKKKRLRAAKDIVNFKLTNAH